MAAPDLFAVKRRACAFAAEWLGITVAEAGVYLGVLIGPAVSAAKRWAAPLAKFEARSRTLGALGLGWNYLLKLFNTVFASLLFYIGQLVTPPPNFSVPLSIALSLVFRLPHVRIHHESSSA